MCARSLVKRLFGVGMMVRHGGDTHSVQKKIFRRKDDSMMRVNLSSQTEPMKMRTSR